MLQDQDIKLRYILLEVDDYCEVFVEEEDDGDFVVFVKDEHEDFEVALAFSPERFQKFVGQLQE